MDTPLGIIPVQEGLKVPLLVYKQEVLWGIPTINATPVKGWFKLVPKI